MLWYDIIARQDKRVGYMTGTEAKVENIGSADSPKSLCIVSVAVINTPFSRKRMQRKTE
jgi:hypothetical protein